jgi:HSP20 family protein
MLLRTATVRDFDRLTARVFDSTTRSSGARLDAYRDGDTFHIDIDLPGVDPASIDVTVDRKVLTVRAERKRELPEGAQLIVAERPTGPVSRQVFLSDTLDTDRLEARYDNGVLTLSIPVTEKAKPRKFEISTGQEQTATGDQELAAV